MRCDIYKDLSYIKKYNKKMEALGFEKAGSFYTDNLKCKYCGKNAIYYEENMTAFRLVSNTASVRCPHCNSSLLTIVPSIVYRRLQGSSWFCPIL